jgi:hypothetical protein
MRSGRSFMAKYGANVAGFFWNAGTLLQFVYGMIAAAPREIVSALFNIASPCSYMLFGHKNGGIAIGGTLGIIGTFLAVYPELMAGEIGTIFGFAAFVPIVMSNIFSPSLTHRFGTAKNAFLRATLGRPRRLSGLGSCIFTRLPIIYESLAHNNPRLASVFALWALGDFALSFSTPNLKKRA